MPRKISSVYSCTLPISQKLKSIPAPRLTSRNSAKKRPSSSRGTTSLTSALKSEEASVVPKSRLTHARQKKISCAACSGIDGTA